VTVEFLGLTGSFGVRSPRGWSGGNRASSLGKAEPVEAPSGGEACGLDPGGPSGLRGAPESPRLALERYSPCISCSVLAAGHGIPQSGACRAPWRPGWGPAHGELASSSLVVSDGLEGGFRHTQSFDPPGASTQLHGFELPRSTGDRAPPAGITGKVSWLPRAGRAQFGAGRRPSTAAAAMRQGQIRANSIPCGRCHLRKTPGLSWVAALNDLMGWIIVKFLQGAVVRG